MEGVKIDMEDSTPSSVVEEELAFDNEDVALWDKTRSFWDINYSLSHELRSERSERARAAEGASKASSPEQANE